jgi:hypothetical protein
MPHMYQVQHVGTYDLQQQGLEKYNFAAYERISKASSSSPRTSEKVVKSR